MKMRVLIIPINYYRSSHEWQSYLSQQLCKTYWHMLINHLTYKITQNLYNDFTILILIVHCFFIAFKRTSQHWPSLITKATQIHWFPELQKQSQYCVSLIAKEIQIHWFLRLQKQSQHRFSLIVKAIQIFWFSKLQKQSQHQRSFIVKAIEIHLTSYHIHKSSILLLCSLLIINLKISNLTS